MKSITVKEAEYTAFRLEKEMLASNEPTPDFSTRFANILENCLAIPFQSFSGKSLYPSFLAKASILFYLMIKNHPFQNENKRIAMTTLFIFLHKNNKWLKVNVQELYNFIAWVASSPRYAKDETVKAIKKFLQAYIIDIKKGGI